MEYIKNLKKFNELSLHELYKIIKLRVDVFVVEQDCPYSDLDDKDQEADHYFYSNEDGEVLAYLRILKAGVSYPQCSIGRVIVHKDFRRYKLGSQLMNDAVQILSSRGNSSIKISAQLYLKKFYGELGFVQVTDEYLEDGIPHIGMVLSLNEK